MMATMSQGPANADGGYAPLHGAWPRTLPHGLVLRKMDIGDLDRLTALHAELHQQSPQQPAPFVREKDAFFAEHLTSAGEVWGLWENAGLRYQLAGYTVIGLPTASDPENFGRDLGIDDEAHLALVAHLDGTGVLPHRRGLGLQRYLTGYRMERARTLGRKTVISMASPQNSFSLSNLLQCGLTVQRLIRKYDALRFVLVRALPGQPTYQDDRHAVTVPLLANAEEHERCLQAGRVGVALRDIGGHFSLVYANRGREAAP
ncbi:hypothetical protein [uncultured Ruegeria sp.]|uniref:hypothetical protein n=1 Tax=uncultured Ruegeria sp. TaxID=259304 RepID=UPI00262AC87F|nr:hypothetical protein [uncultured Ruegeria sp.]